MAVEYQDFGFADAEALCSESYILPVLLDALQAEPGARILDIGCGNGSLVGQLLRLGYQVVGVDLSPAGIEIARRAHPEARFEVLPADAALAESLQDDPFDAVVSTEVIEHLYDPMELVQGAFACLKPGGRVVVSTPYHGWLKNCAVAVTNSFDKHVNPLFRGGHIKFFSRRTLSSLMQAAGFQNVQFRGAGRVPFLWKSMVVSAERPRG